MRGVDRYVVPEWLKSSYRQTDSKETQICLESCWFSGTGYRVYLARHTKAALTT